MSPRLAALALLMSACIERPTPVGRDADPPTDRAAAEPGDPQAAQTSRAAASREPEPEPERGGAPEPANSLISVVTSLAPGTAQPCEQTCGRVGDCLHETGRRADVSTRLELQCLDACVHSPAEDPALAEFLACESHTDCATLTGCAERSWNALLGARVGPEVEGIIDTSPSCQTACEWLIACVSVQMPPSARPFDAHMNQQVRSCVDSCASDPVMFAEFTSVYECIVNSCEDPFGCFGAH